MTATGNGSVDHFAFNTGQNTTVFSLAHNDFGDTYSASGEFPFRLTFHSVERVTVSTPDRGTRGGPRT